MKTLVIIILLLMAWKGAAICAEDKPKHKTPEWLEGWHREFEEEERQKEEEIRRRLHVRDSRQDEGREGLA